jgi:hypothetical protein
VYVLNSSVIQSVVVGADMLLLLSSLSFCPFALPVIRFSLPMDTEGSLVRLVLVLFVSNNKLTLSSSLSFFSLFLRLH